MRTGEARRDTGLMQTSVVSIDRYRGRHRRGGSRGLVSVWIRGSIFLLWIFIQFSFEESYWIGQTPHQAVHWIWALPPIMFWSTMTPAILSWLFLSPLRLTYHDKKKLLITPWLGLYLNWCQKKVRRNQNIEFAPFIFASLEVYFLSSSMGFSDEGNIFYPSPAALRM